MGYIWRRYYIESDDEDKDEDEDDDEDDDGDNADFKEKKHVADHGTKVNSS